MKKLFALLAIVSLSVPLYGCGGDTKKTEEKKTTVTDTKVEKTDTPPKTP